jgi:hypothetical protein
MMNQGKEKEYFDKGMEDIHQIMAVLETMEIGTPEHEKLFEEIRSQLKELIGTVRNFYEKNKKD